MESNEKAFCAVLIIGFGAIALFALIHFGSTFNDCTPGERGNLRTPGVSRYSTMTEVQVCDGAHWVPYRVELPQR